MNAPPSIDPVTAHSDRDVLHWLTNDTRDERFMDNIFCKAVRASSAGGYPRQAGVASYPDPPSAVAWRPDDVGRRDARGRD